MFVKQAPIETKGLVKHYKEEVLAVDGIDLAIEDNTIYSLLGPNGAGKTTTLSILTTLLEPTAGSAKVCGLDVVKQAIEQMGAEVILIEGQGESERFIEALRAMSFTQTILAGNDLIQVGVATGWRGFLYHLHAARHHRPSRL